MPRRPRIYLPGIPAHIVQRGNNREPCFYNFEDYRYYLQCLQHAKKRYTVELHAYVLMTNHVHLLLTPSDATGISRMMALIGKNYVMYINKTYKRTGTLWEGRHKSSLVDEENYLLQCYKYIELNPVRAAMVNSPDEYVWSSYQHHAWGKYNDLISDHWLYTALAKEQEERQHVYRDLFKAELFDSDVHEISNATQFNFPLGNNRFKEKIEEMTKRKLGYASSGRPSKTG